jgi:hypothetical protein
MGQPVERRIKQDHHASLYARRTARPALITTRWYSL